MVHAVLIGAHAIAAVVAFVSGLLVAWNMPARMNARFGAYVAALGLMLVFLLLAIATDWFELESMKRAIFLGLLVLGTYTAFRGWRAMRELRSHMRPEASVGDVGFTLIALFDGFMIVTAFDVGSPIWLVLVVGALGIVLGIVSIHYLKCRAVQRAQRLGQ